MKRCTATITMRGHEIRCENEVGHDSAHYGDHWWWPNDQPIPEQTKPSYRTLFLVSAAMLIVALLVAALLLTR